GDTLAEKLEAGVPLPLSEALAIACRLAGALHHAHARGIVHRDIKPANIMILSQTAPPASATADAPERRSRVQSEIAVKIMDFGIAKLPASQLTAAGEFFGTPSYMSPEQALGRELDGRSDLFSLGCVLY